MPTFSYVDQTPVASQPPSTSPGAFVTNFTSIDDLIGVDHVSFNEVNGGTHTQVTIPTPLATDPSLTSPSGEIYTKAVSTLTQLFFANATTVTQLTGNATSIAANGYITIPGGLIIQWGHGTASNASGGTLNNFPITFPHAVFAVVATVYNSGSTVRSISEVGTASTSGFYALSPNSSNSIYYIAIGN